MNTPNRDVMILEPHTATAVVLTPMDMVSKAVESGANIEVLTKLMDLQERWEGNQARKAFDEAIASAKAEIGPVMRNATGHNNKRYADFAAYARAVDPIISKYGLSYRFRTSQTDRINVTCILSHKAGHSEENTLCGPADKTGSKNDIQAIGSTLTYLQRYTLVQSLGLAASNDDDGRVAGVGGSISDDQIAELRQLIVEVAADIPKFCAYFKVERIDDIPASDFARAKAALNAKRTQRP
ncbi:Essential recombination function protein [uncultured Caudovirales phage]|uniref:Essential recombination function protein n=1 Tax=uncultured Caudovirales phage TaxID=2100421 RepID=A0A6J5MGW8_9CAUD|nr:Essential recombination function protein [uncultured Caudovirales phage]CAB4176828.1 Essential recombination function protein [uncultured Caudovirales phage]CAB4190076.1 Essential recombination function protein [uncultured Caudovirales phage]